MDAYLKIAQVILNASRRPMTAREVIEAAYQAGVVPEHLYGKTQHKTLQARLSEDILRLRDRSQFFRTDPGRFFLRSLLTDETLPSDFRSPIVSRRRERELHGKNLLAIDISDISIEGQGCSLLTSSKILSLLEGGRYSYCFDHRSVPSGAALIWSFVMIVRQQELLSYRIGRYRDGRDAFLAKRSVGFFTTVTEDDNSLFDGADKGISSSGIAAAAIDLGVPHELFDSPDHPAHSTIIRFAAVQNDKSDIDMLAIVRFDCPSWFEPTRRRLALNDLQWINIHHRPNNEDDFDPWSRCALEALRLDL